MSEQFMKEAIQLSQEGMSNGQGGPFGAVIVKDGRIIGRGFNRVLDTCDPTAHAEVVAIRNACQTLGHFSLEGCEIYTSCEPCPMCLASIYWARIDRIYYGATQLDAAKIGFDDAKFYEEMSKPVESRSVPMQELLRKEALKPFQVWMDKQDKTMY